MRTSLIITTYNWPQALNLVLRSLLNQRVMPDEVIIADDGSGTSTRNLIEDWRDKLPIPVVHAWQEDHGFRVSRVRNLGASRAQGDYLIFIDGDMVMHRGFIQSHLAHQQPSRFLHGPRVLISNDLTERYLNSGGSFRFHPLLKGVKNRLNMIHAIWASHLVSRNDAAWKSRACNLSMHKSDFAKVNGFNEDFEGWGMEDSELAIRLIRAGIVKFHLRLCGVAYHLGHANSYEVTQSADAIRNMQLLEQTRSSDIIACANGLSNHASR